MMTHENVSLETLEELVGGLQDIHDSYVALIGKVTQFKMNVESASLDDFSTELDKPFGTASDNAVLVEQLLKKLEMERNKVKHGA